MADANGSANGQVDLYAFALSIADRVQEIQKGLQQRNLAQPSLDVDGPSPDFIPADDVTLQDLRRGVVSDARLLADTFAGPMKHLMELFMMPNHDAWTMNALYAYDIPRHVPLTGSISFADLSKACGMEEDKLTRIVRYVMLNHVFDEKEPGKVSHSAASKLMATSQVTMDFLGHSCEDVFPAAFSQVAAMKKSSTNNSVFDCGLSHHFSNGKKQCFDILSEDPARVKRFAGAMEFTNLPGSFVSAAQELVPGVDWPSLGNIHVVDVGGSSGATARELLRNVPSIAKVTVQDLPEVIAAVKPEHRPADLADRLAFETGNFFERQKITDAHVYLLRRILHDWPSDKTLEIFRNLVPSMPAGSRLVVNDAVVPESNDEPYLAKVTRAADLQMMVALNARERTLGEWQAIAREAIGGELEFESVRGNVLVWRKV